MTEHAVDLFNAAERLDESPMEILNGGAADALRVLDSSASEIATAAETCGIHDSYVDALLERAGSRLREVPEPVDVYPAAAEAATLLYAAAWVLKGDDVTAEHLKDLL